jgi:hypothetical protein
MRLTDRQRELLNKLEYYHRKNEWARVIDVGGYNRSYHHSVLQQLVRKGLAEQKRRICSVVGALGSSRAGKHYRLTAAGVEAQRRI